MKIQLNHKSLCFIINLTLILSILVFSGVESFAVEPALATSQATSSSTDQSDVKTSETLPADSKIFAVDKPQVSAEKKPLPFKTAPKRNLKKIVLKFIIAMFGVLISALAIFGGLKLFKIITSKGGSSSYGKKNISSLESPKTLKEAINLFLDKTNK